MLHALIDMDGGPTIRISLRDTLLCHAPFDARKKFLQLLEIIRTSTSRQTYDDILFG
jgi:hypothetical protein